MGIINMSESLGQENPCNRKAIAAGRFYSDDAGQLIKDLEECFENADRTPNSDLRAIIVPHAGYVFSGATAAKAFAAIDLKKKYQRIFLIASSHYTSHPGASIFSRGDYKTPLGVVATDRRLTESLSGQKELFRYHEDAHDREHSLEVQLPFIQYLYKNNQPPIVPIVITSQDVRDCRRVAEALRPWFTNDNLFVISSDFSHYPAYEDAYRVDNETANSILTGDPEVFLRTLQRHADEGVEKLATSTCGWTSILTLMYLSANHPAMKYSHIAYTNSGDHPAYGDKKGVVGYHAMSLSNKEIGFVITKEEEKELLGFARNVIENALTCGEKIRKPSTSPTLNKKCGAFVTLRNSGELRGCIGRFGDSQKLWQVVEEMAVSAALHDTRFEPLTIDELDDINIEISILTPMQKIDSIDDIVLGKHGVYLKRGFNSGTFLPQVATEAGWDLEQMLGHLSHDKAKIGWDGWRNAELYIYESIIIKE